MTKEEIIVKLKEKDLQDIIVLLNDAEKGHLEELELVESIGLLDDEQLNRSVISLLQEMGVTIIYVTDDDEEEEEEEEEEEV
jgi:hypothetical protein